MTNRYNNHDNVCGAVIMTKAVARVHPVHLMCEKNVFTFFVILVAFLTFFGVFKFFELVVIKKRYVTTKCVSCVWGQFGPENKLIEGQPNEYDVICRNASLLAFHLWPTIFAGTPFRLQNIYRNGVPPRCRTTTPLAMPLSRKFMNFFYLFGVCQS